MMTSSGSSFTDSNRLAEWNTCISQNKQESRAAGGSFSMRVFLVTLLGRVCHPFREMCHATVRYQQISKLLKSRYHDIIYESSRIKMHAVAAQNVIEMRLLQWSSSNSTDHPVRNTPCYEHQPLSSERERVFGSSLFSHSGFGYAFGVVRPPLPTSLPKFASHHHIGHLRHIC
ncbi:uncharacterized protein LOC111258630 [Varroa jacobsoni]|uniref:uncharacterized protein LOC111258630 n=1 Tax=Varroa jacobsoni TaxID=62625 RepID=UPI000BF5B831|nr:uncharacterized protein LOC111258630 [Varroa jacobsoni]